MEAITSSRIQTAEDADLSKPVLKAPMDRDTLLAALRSALEAMFPSENGDGSLSRLSHRAIRVRRNGYADSLKTFGEFLTASGQCGVTVDEDLIARFTQYIQVQKEHWGAKSRDGIAVKVRTLINALPQALRNRRLLSPNEHRRVTRYDWCSPETQDVIRQFLSDGRSTRRKGNEIPTLTGRLLSEAFRTAIVGFLTVFLKTVGKSNVYEIIPSDADKYLDEYTAKGNRQLGINNLAAMQPFFNNLLARGLIDKSPFNAVYAKRTNVDDDFVPPEGVAVLMELSTVDMNDMVAVRDRLLAVCLCYDFALRIGEVARLKVSDVSIQDYVELTIRSEVQKGYGKPAKLDYSYFRESRTLMTAYLKLREAKQPATDALIITDKGRAMLESGCRDAVQKLCKKLGVKTFKGKVPAPHRFRHSFGTCNVKPLGLGLDIYDVMKRLRHTSIELTTRTYISDNPLLAKAKHYAHANGTGTATGKANGKAVGGSAVSAMLPHRQGMGCQDQPMGRAPSPSRLLDGAQNSVMPEYEALGVLAPLRLIRMSLQQYAKNKGLAEKRKGAWCYSRQLIDDLSQNYFTKQEAMKIIGFSKSAFFYWMSSRCIEQVVIGKVSLVRKDVVLAKSRVGEVRKSA